MKQLGFSIEHRLRIGRYTHKDAFKGYKTVEQKKWITISDCKAISRVGRLGKVEVKYLWSFCSLTEKLCVLQDEMQKLILMLSK